MTGNAMGAAEETRQLVEKIDAAADGFARDGLASPQKVAAIIAKHDALFQKNRSVPERDENQLDQSFRR